MNMKDCDNCEYCNGFDYDDGTPDCTCEGGMGSCPYNDEGKIKEDKFKITLDIPNITDYIKHTVRNTVDNAVRGMIEDCVKKMVKEKIEDTAEAYVEESLKKVVDDEIKAYMQNDITVGGGWSEPERKMSRNDYLSECTAKVVESQLSAKKISETVIDYCKGTIDRFARDIKDDVNYKIKNTFDNATKQALSENVVTMLMSGETYQKLSDSMGRILK